MRACGPFFSTKLPGTEATDNAGGGAQQALGLERALHSECSQTVGTPAALIYHTLQLYRSIYNSFLEKLCTARRFQVALLLSCCSSFCGSGEARDVTSFPEDDAIMVHRVRGKDGAERFDFDRVLGKASTQVTRFRLPRTLCFSVLFPFLSSSTHLPSFSLCSASAFSFS